MENRFFNFYFLIQDISFKNYITSMKFHMPNENIHLEGTVSQNFYIGLSFYLMKCRKIIMRK